MRESRHNHGPSKWRINPMVWKSRGPSLRFSLRKLLLFTFMASIVSTTVGLPHAQYRRESAICKTLEERGAWVEWRPRTRRWGSDFFSSLGFGQAYLRIHSIDLENWNIKNEDIVELSKLENLTWLSLGDSSIDDDGLVHLNNCKSLAHLDMKNNASITDVGLRNLNLTNLRSLNVDGTNVTYEGLHWIAKRNPMLDEPALIGRIALARLEQCQFRFSPQIVNRSKLQSRDGIKTGQNSRLQWHDAAEHLREFPGLVIAQFRDLPENAGPEVEWGLTLSIVNVVDDAEILPSDVQPRNNTLAAVAIIPPLGTAVSQLLGVGTIRAWFGDPDWPAKVGTDSLEIASSAEIVFVDGTSLPVTVELREL